MIMHLVLIIRLLSFEERMPSAYYCYDKVFVTKYMVLYRRPTHQAHLSK